MSLLLGLSSFGHSFVIKAATAPELGTLVWGCASVTDRDPDSLAASLAEFDIDLPSDQVAQLEQYCHLLWDWNSKLNLTRHTDYQKFVARDLTDTLALADFLEPNEEVLDVGTGGGVPGVLLAIMRKDTQITLCESVGKKARAVDAIVSELQLPVAVYHARAEQLLEDFRFHTLVARAVGPLRKMMTWFEPHWASIGRLLLIKGPNWVEDRAEARHHGLCREFELRRLRSYLTPGTNIENVVLQLRHSG